MGVDVPDVRTKGLWAELAVHRVWSVGGGTNVIEKRLAEVDGAGAAADVARRSTAGSRYGVDEDVIALQIAAENGLEAGDVALARIGGLTYIMDASRKLTAGAVDQGHRPSVASAILKYHCTEMGRQVANDTMDVHGGKAICLGPKNYAARGYQSVPIAITVEGANILTRSLIIYG